MKKLAIITSHPIQYNAPLFQIISHFEKIYCKVFYTWSQSAQSVFDPGFGIERSWDIPLLEGYEYQFVENISKDPGSHHFKGIINPGLIETLNSFKPDAILIFGWSFHSHLSCLRHFKGNIPVIFRGDSTLLDEKPGAKKLLRRIFLKWVYSHVDFALYVGQNNRNYYLALGLKEEQLVFAPHAIDNQRFSEKEDLYEIEAKLRRGKLGIQENDIVLLFAGKLEDKKDPGFLIRLANAIQDTKLKILIVGNGHLEEKLKEQASGDKRIIFLDFQNQQSMPVIYRMGDIFVLPSVRNETWGLAINEAMVCRRPVIASARVGCAPDLVEDGVNGWVFEPGKEGEERIHDLIRNQLDDRKELIKMGIFAAEKIKGYDYHIISRNISDLFQKIFDKNKQV